MARWSRNCASTNRPSRSWTRWARGWASARRSTTSCSGSRGRSPVRPSPSRPSSPASSTQRDRPLLAMLLTPPHRLVLSHAEPGLDGREAARRIVAALHGGWQPGGVLGEPELATTIAAEWERVTGQRSEARDPRVRLRADARPAADRDPGPAPPDRAHRPRPPARLDGRLRARRPPRGDRPRRPRRAPRVAPRGRSTDRLRVGRRGSDLDGLRDGPDAPRHPDQLGLHAARAPRPRLRPGLLRGPQRADSWPTAGTRSSCSPMPTTRPRTSSTSRSASSGSPRSRRSTSSSTRLRDAEPERPGPGSGGPTPSRRARSP